MLKKCTPMGMSFFRNVNEIRYIKWLDMLIHEIGADLLHRIVSSIVCSTGLTNQFGSWKILRVGGRKSHLSFIIRLIQTRFL